MAKPPRIAVAGSINMDLVVRCRHLPGPGETVIASDSTEVCGGKGANQAVAAARAGGTVSMVGRVGSDAFAPRLLANLREAGIETDRVEVSEGASGLAVVAVEDSGQNAILVSAGANGDLSEVDVMAARETIEGCSALLLQLEVPLPTVVAAMEIARRAGVRVLLDPAPAPRQSLPELLQADLLCPNESEAAALVGHPVESDDEIERAARTLNEAGGAQVVITLGERGAALFDGTELLWVPAFDVEVADTTAAGDAFAGALAVRWCETDDLLEAVRFGNAAGALAASRPGAQPSVASRREIEKLSTVRS